MEAAFVEKIHRMDGQALGNLHDQLYPLVYRYIRYRLEDEQLVEDLVSETFMRLLDHLGRSKGRVLDFKAWLLGTASHLVHDHLRDQYHKPVENFEEHDDLPGENHTEGTVEENQKEQEIRQAMKNLTDEQQQVLALRFTQELSLEETARIMGKNINAVKALQFRAIGAMRRQFVENSNQ
jgi:RNA polymerase sigma-70 factor (ECF subfamily)